MKVSLVEWLRCPACGNEDLELAIESEREGEIESGHLSCPSCHERFPIVRSIPRFVPSDNYVNTFGFQWNQFRLTQLDSHSKTSISRDRMLEQTGWSDEMIKGATVIDAGCGAGRFAEVALDMGAEVFALDYSNAVDVCWKNLGPHPNLHIVQADILALPFKQNRFDYVYSFGVLMSTADPPGSFKSLVPLLKSPNGRMVVDVYGKSWMTRFNTKYWVRPLTK